MYNDSNNATGIGYSIEGGATEPLLTGCSQPHDDDDDENENKEREGWFAGGKRSGLSIENPDRQTAMPGGKMARDLLRRAAQAGPPPPKSSNAFTGGGHTLNSDEEVESSYIPDTVRQDAKEDTVIRHLTFWRNGFQFEDGELMRYDDPANTGVLEEINAGHAPTSIMNVSPGQLVEVRVAKRITEDYKIAQSSPLSASYLTSYLASCFKC